MRWYVYRLIDPRNGETFYVGKGKGNRVFAHAKGDWISTVSEDTATSDDEDKEDASDLRIKRISEIRSVGLEVSHVIHRHGIEREATAYEVEAALIDAYPGLTNLVSGRGSGDHGSRHVEEIVRQYAAEEFQVREPLMLIYIGRYQHLRDDPYESVRLAWKVNVEKARQYGLVLAHANGLVVGAYRPSKWTPATQENFPHRLDEDIPTRWGFTGESAETEVWSLYVGKRVPEQYRGGQNPVRYCAPGDA